MKTIFRLANFDDLNGVYSIFVKAIENMDSHGIFQWDNLYPNKEVLQEDIEKGEMYILQQEDVIVSAIVLNEHQEIEYQSVLWDNDKKNAAVIHRLCVNPIYQNQGIGKLTVSFAEILLKEKNYQSIRLDAYSLNPHALKMYEKLGYNKKGEVIFRKGKFYLYEKTL